MLKYTDLPISAKFSKLHSEYEKNSLEVFPADDEDVPVQTLALVDLSGTLHTLRRTCAKNIAFSRPRGYNGPQACRFYQAERE